MTWDELAKRIGEMPESERTKQVFYCEPWDKEADMFAVNVYKTGEDLLDPDGAINVRKGDNFLQ